jgi:hypothetical protein
MKLHTGRERPLPVETVRGVVVRDEASEGSIDSWMLLVEGHR